MNIKDIIAKRTELEKKLNIELSSWGRKEDIYQIRIEILRLQQQCPHTSSELNWPILNGVCPYCGKGEL